MRIAIAGNIGAGKTSLTKQLSKSFLWARKKSVYPKLDHPNYFNSLILFK